MSSLPGQIRFVALKHVSSIGAIIDGSNEETTTLVGYLPPGESLTEDCHRAVVDWMTVTRPATGTSRPYIALCRDGSLKTGTASFSKQTRGFRLKIKWRRDLFTDLNGSASESVVHVANVNGRLAFCHPNHPAAYAFFSLLDIDMVLVADLRMKIMRFAASRFFLGSELTNEAFGATDQAAADAYTRLYLHYIERAKNGGPVTPMTTADRLFAADPDAFVEYVRGQLQQT